MAGGGAGAGNVVPVAPAAVVPAVVNTGGAPGARNLAAGVLSCVAAEGLDGVRYGEVIDGVNAPGIQTCAYHGRWPADFLHMY